MKLKEYIDQLKDLESNGHGDLEVIFSSDDEGNYYILVNYSPSLVNCDEDMVVIADEDLEEFDTKKYICIN